MHLYEKWNSTVCGIGGADLVTGSATYNPTGVTCSECLHVLKEHPLKPTDHRYLLSVVRYLPEDYAPYGQVEREDPVLGWGPDCSMGCKFFIPLGGKLGMDWGVCVNSKSHRFDAKLTFEHQGCREFVADDTD